MNTDSTSDLPSNLSLLIRIGIDALRYTSSEKKVSGMIQPTPICPLEVSEAHKLDYQRSWKT